VRRRGEHRGAGGAEGKVWGGVSSPTGGVVWGGSSAPSPENFLSFRSQNGVFLVDYEALNLVLRIASPKALIARHHWVKAYL
jgi:hypothetical protein